MRYEKGAFVTVPNVHKLREVSVGARAVFMEICVFSDEYGKCFPSRKTIAENIQMHPNSVDRFLEELEEKGLLNKSGRHRQDGSRTSNEYQIIVIPLTTHGDTPLTTHSEAELYPVLTKPTSIVEASSTEPFVVVEEKETTREKKPRKLTPEARAVFDLFGPRCYQMVGIRKQEVEAAVFLSVTFTPKVLKAAMAYIEENKDKDHFFSIHSPYDLRIKWEKLKAHKNKHS